MLNWERYGINKESYQGFINPIIYRPHVKHSIHSDAYLGYFLTS